jgi:riboflavin synthase
VVGLDPVGDSTRLRVAAGADLAPYIAAKGSVALDGVSLTVNEVETTSEGGVIFSINLIPHTAAQTTFGDLALARKLHIEIDILARYLGRMMELRATAV